MNREYKKRLQDIGIAEKEASVYITLLESGAATADQTAKGAHLNRSTTYVQLERLMEIGLVTTFKRGKKTFFAAESPQNLERLIEQKRQKLELDKATIAAFIPDLMKVYSASGNAPIVRLYEGKEGITSLRNLILDSKDKAVFIASNIKKTEELYSKPELESYYEQLQKNRLRINVLYSAPDSFSTRKALPSQKMKRISHQAYPFKSDVYIFDDYVAFVSCETNVHGVLMQSDLIAQTMRSFFSLVWNSVETYQPQTE